VAEKEISDVILHLLEEEKKSAAMLAEAQAEADKSVAKARAEAGEKYKTRFEQLIARLEDSYAKETAVITNEYTTNMEQYRAKLGNIAVDTGAFNALLDKLLKRA
jgi:F0F1-type ATP synthase membrane subunit b/b'